MKSQRRPILITFIVAYILYVAAESRSAGWIAPQLHRVGYSQSIGSLVTASFWGGLAIGRVVGGPLCRRLSDRILVLGGLGLAFVLCVGALSNSLAPYAYPLLGLVTASVYPMGLIWYTVLCPHDSDGLALLIIFMMAGRDRSRRRESDGLPARDPRGAPGHRGLRAGGPGGRCQRPSVQTPSRGLAKTLGDHHVVTHRLGRTVALADRSAYRDDVPGQCWL
jgi:hypothetical protein